MRLASFDSMMTFRTDCRAYACVLLLALFLSSCGGGGDERPDDGGKNVQADGGHVDSGDVDATHDDAGRGEAQLCADLPGRYAAITTLRASGGRSDWSVANGRIAFDRAGEDDNYDIYTMNMDGSDEVCLTCDFDEATGLGAHRGNAAWHPSGRFIVFESGPNRPGLGAKNNLWSLEVETGELAKLTDHSEVGDRGVLHPHFSHDGTQLTWTEMHTRANLFRRGQELGYWRLAIASFEETETGPALSNVETVEPVGEGFYENHGLSPDGSLWIFSSNGATNPGTSAFRRSDIYAYDMNERTYAALTSDGYNEHAEVSPDGTLIVWMSTTDNTQGTDYWLMSIDGSNKRRLTYFNVPGTPHHREGTQTAADSSWHPDGTHLAAYVQNNLLLQTGSTLLIDLYCD